MAHENMLIFLISRINLDQINSRQILAGNNVKVNVIDDLS